MRQLFARILRWRGRHRLVAVMALPLLTLIIAVLLADAAALRSRTVVWREVPGIAVAFLLVNLGQAAWAGFLQTRLERRHNFFLAAALPAIPFAAVHMPLKVINGEVRTPWILPLPSPCSRCVGLPPVAVRDGDARSRHQLATGGLDPHRLQPVQRH